MLGAFATLRKKWVEFNLSFFRLASGEKAGFHKVYQKNKTKKSGWLLTFIFSSSCFKKPQVAPSKSLFRVQINGAFDNVLKVDLAQIKHYKIVCFQKALLHNQSFFQVGNMKKTGLHKRHCLETRPCPDYTLPNCLLSESMQTIVKMEDISTLT